MHWRFDQIVHAGYRICMNVHGPFHIDGGAYNVAAVDVAVADFTVVTTLFS